MNDWTHCPHCGVPDGKSACAACDCLVEQGMREGAPVGRKDDSSKLRYDLIPPYALEALAHVYTIGAARYGDGNYLKGMDWSRVGGALMRHYEAWRKGESLDKDDGQHHLASVAWCAFTLMVYEDQCIGSDDRGLVIEGATDG